MNAAAQRFALQVLPSRPWKNGAGLTREIAAAPADATLERFDWRLSVAEVAADGPFSVFEGIDRTIVLWRGAGMQLQGDHLDHRLDRPGAPWGFPGEARVGATLLDGPTQDLNVMTRRGAWRAEVQTIRAPATLEPADVRLVLCGAGRWHLPGTPPALGADHGLLWRAPCGRQRIEPVEGEEPWAVVVRLCQDPAP